jgi:hypothetical protein
MPELKEIDYGVLIDRLIQDFRPVKRLWPIGIRLTLWTLLELAILTLAVMLNGGLLNYGLEAVGFLLVSVAAAWMALRNSIPGRETNAVELGMLAIGVVAAALIAQFEALNWSAPLAGDFLPALERQLSLAALPGIALFWAVRRGMPTRPRLTGGVMGVAASAFAIAADLISGAANSLTWKLLAAGILTGLSVIAGAVWLDSGRAWHKYKAGVDRSAEPQVEFAWLGRRVVFPLAGALAAGVLLLVLRAGTGGSASVPDFDRAIANYQQSLANFRPNVPSKSIETVLTAYIEHGMPSYMWDFGPQGFKLVGGRFEHLADGTPVTYTWFRGTKAGVMCMFRQTSGFLAPPATHIDRDHLLFYRYHGYSVCLVNVGGYGDFISVIVSPIQMKPFMSMVLGALSSEQH